MAMKFAALALLSVIGVSHAANLRRVALRGGVSAGPILAFDPEFEVLTATSITEKSTDDCLCKEGQFWHWRIKKCIEQGPWGYECGFFPGEHHRFVCKDGLLCAKLDDTEITYQHEGAVPASCQHCLEDDVCESGQQRHAAECLKETTLSGEASCTVRLTLMANATATATKQHTASATASHTVTSEATGESAGGTKVTAKVESEHTSNAGHTASATRAVTAEAVGVGEVTATVTIEEVMEELGLKGDQKLGPVLAAQVIAEGDQMAFDRAYAAALKAAQAHGDALAEETARKLAADKAAADARLEAEAEAAEQAAWKAEAGAKAKATEDQDGLQSDADAAATAMEGVVADGPTASADEEDELEPAVDAKVPPVPRKIPKVDHQNKFP